MFIWILSVFAISSFSETIKFSDSSLAAAAKSSHKYCSATKSTSEIRPKLLPCTENMSSEECQMFHYTNAVRINCDLKPFTGSPKCVEAARDHTNEMVKKKYFDHKSPNGTQPMNRMQTRGVEANLYAENIAWDPGRNSLEIIKGWMDSKGHRRNILDPNITHLGIGTSFGNYHGGNGRFWNQCFHAGKGTAAMRSAAQTDSTRRPSNHDGGSLIPVLAIAGITIGAVLIIKSRMSRKPTGGKQYNTKSLPLTVRSAQGQGIK